MTDEVPEPPADDAPPGVPWTEQIVPETEEPQGHPTRAADVMPLVDKEIA